MISKFGADNLESLVSDLLVVASGNDVHIALAGQLENGGVDATNTTKAEEEDVGFRHCAIAFSVSVLCELISTKSRRVIFTCVQLVLCDCSAISVFPNTSPRISDPGIRQLTAIPTWKRHTKSSGSYSEGAIPAGRDARSGRQYFERQKARGAVEWENMYMHKEGGAMRRNLK